MNFFLVFIKIDLTSENNSDNIQIAQTAHEKMDGLQIYENNGSIKA